MNDKQASTGFSRRDFFKGIGITAVAAAAEKVQAAADELQSLNGERPLGPGAISITLRINGEQKEFQAEPRVTLLDLLRNQAHLTGAKEVCDRGTCGACTVLINGEPMYACMMLAVEAQGQEITTVEGLAAGGKLTAVQQAFVECDGLQCGFCTPGFVLSVTALLNQTPKPTEKEVRKACSGNLCRCGSYPRVFDAALSAAGVKPAGPASTVMNVSIEGASNLV